VTIGRHRHSKIHDVFNPTLLTQNTLIALTQDIRGSSFYEPDRCTIVRLVNGRLELTVDRVQWLATGLFITFTTTIA
jgi:hypothetical protein